MPMNLKPKLLYFVTEDWYFCSHRLNLAIAAQRQGFEVTVLTRVNEHADFIRQQGFNLIPLDVERGGLNPLREAKTLIRVMQIYSRERPALVHHVALKPVLYGGLAALFVNGIRSVNLIAGLGAIFSSDRKKAKFLKPLVRKLLRILFRTSDNLIIVQNSEDKSLLINELRICEAKVKLIKGSGVDTQKFFLMPEPAGRTTIALVSRMLWDKGIGEYIAAIQILKRKGLDFSALLVGEPDDENIASVGRDQLVKWHDAGIVEWLGYQSDIPSLWKNVHVAVLPSYREGLPKSLLEAAACGRPIVTTDTSGCREIVQEGLNGLLVPVGDELALANALEELIINSELRRKMGTEGRRMVEQEFSDQEIIAQTLAVYRELR